MSIGLLNTGDEIILGDTLNTNAQQIAQNISSEALLVNLQLACGDRREEIVNSIKFLAQNCQIIIITGGLGPTTDDRTRFALADYLQVPLIEFSQALAHIQSLNNKTGLAMNAGNRQQALFPAAAKLFPNPFGSAMGCYLQKENIHFILLPGPPRECLPMFFNYALPILQQFKADSRKLLKWRLFAVAESFIGEKMEAALKELPCQTGYRLEVPYLECKVWCEPDLVNKITNILNPLFAPYIIATPKQKASERLVDLIKTKKISLSIIDEATGGALQALTQTPDTYEFIKFYHQKNSLFTFEIRGLEEYWIERKPGSVSLDLQGQYKDQNFCEKHVLPFYSPLVIQTAAEFSAFRFSQIIDSLH